MLEIDFSDESNSKIGTCYSCKKEDVVVIASWTYNCFLCKDCFGK